MGLYNMIFGRSPAAEALVTLVFGIQAFDPGRFRDAWLETDGDGVLIRIHTRNGGGNREDQADAILSMQQHPWYDHDEDLPFDTTYADFYFRPVVMEARQFGQEALDMLSTIAVPPIDMNQRWKDAIDAIAPPPQPPAAGGTA